MKNDPRHRFTTSATVLLLLFAFGLFPPLVQPQQDEPLGDVARQQHALKEYQQTSEARKVYRSSDVASPQSGQKGAAETPAATTPKSDSVEKPKEAVGTTSKKDNGPAPTIVFNRPKNKAKDDDDFVVVPAGTEIRVAVTSSPGWQGSTAIEQGQVTAQVFIGSITAIPALSKVHLEFAGYGGCDDVSYSGCQSLYRVANVEVRGVVYRTETNVFAYSPGTMGVTLTKALRIAR